MTDTKERRGDPADAGPSVDHVHLAGAGVVAATTVVAASAANGLSGTAVDPGTLVAVAVVAAPVGIALGARYRNWWVPPALVAGGLTAAFLFLRGFVQGQSVSYPLLFGLPGAVVAVGFMLGGAWVEARLRVMREPSQVSSLTRAGLVVAGGWTGIEFLFALGVTVIAGSMPDNTFVSILVATTIGFPVAVLFAVRYGRRRALTAKIGAIGRPAEQSASGWWPGY